MSKRFDTAVDAAWGRFEERLGEALQGIGDGVIELGVPVERQADGATPYVQFAGYGGDRVMAEVSGNAYLDEACRLTDEQEQTLEVLGWERPAGEDHPNWWSDTGPDEVEVLGSMVVSTLRHVFGVLHPQFLRSERVPLGDPPDETVEEEPDEPAVVGYPQSYDDLVEMVGSALAQRASATVERDDDGDYPVSDDVIGNAWVRVLRSRPVVRVFGTLVGGIDEEDADRARLECNLLNRRVPLVKFEYRNGVVLGVCDVLAGPMVGSQVLNTVDAALELFGEHAPDLAERLGGRSWMEPIPFDPDN